MVRYSKRRSRNRKRHHGGSGLSPLNPTSVDFASKESLTDIQRIPITNPSPILARSQPFIPPRPGAPSPPPPLGPTSGPAFGLKIGPPPLLSFGGSKGGRRKSRRGMRVKSGKFVPVGSRGKGKWRCVVYGRHCTRVKRGGRKSHHGGSKSCRRKSRRGMRVKSGKFVPVGSRGKGKWSCVVYGRRCTRVKRGGRKSRRGGSKGGGCGCMSKGGRIKKGGGNIHLPNPFGKLSFDANPFNNQSDSSTGQVSSEQAAADKNQGAFSSSEHTSQLHANTVLGTGGKRRKSKKRHRKMKGGGDFFKNLFNMGEKNSDSSGNESKHSEKHSEKHSNKHETKNEDKHESKNEKEVDWNPFDNQSDSSTGQVSAEQAAADKRQGAESSSSYTKQSDFKTLWENAFEHGKISGGKRRKSKKFKKHYMWNTKGKRYIAKTHKQHLRGVKLGHTHKKSKRK